MMRIALWGLTTVSAVALLFGYRTSTDPGGGTATASRTTVDDGTTARAVTGSAAAAAAGSAAATPAGGLSATTSGTFTGASASTRWGPVQVRITVASGRITDAETIVYPTANGKDQQINARAVPAYEQYTVQAQSARIDHLSGATVTWEGYTTSLQSALDQAAQS